MRSATGQCKHQVDGQWKHVVCWNGGNGSFLLRAVPEKKSSGGGRQRFFVRRVGCLGAKCVRRVEEEMNGRCPGGGCVDTALR